MRLLLHQLQSPSMIPAGYICNTLIRGLSTSTALTAGFQGVKGSGNTIAQAMMERKKKLIKRLEKQALQPRPVKDLKIRYSWKLSERERVLPELSSEEIERRTLLKKAWSRHVSKFHLSEDETMKRLKRCQDRALLELRKESEELYQAAIEPDISFATFVIEGPSETLPIKNYSAPLGCTTHWEEEA